jgi:hypothetical protein
MFMSSPAFSPPHGVWWTRRGVLAENYEILFSFRRISSNKIALSQRHLALGGRNCWEKDGWSCKVVITINNRERKEICTSEREKTCKPKKAEFSNGEIPLEGDTRYVTVYPQEEGQYELTKGKTR